jgi:hypothetical protein
MVSKHKISHVYALTRDDYEWYLPQKMKSNKILQEILYIRQNNGW